MSRAIPTSVYALLLFILLGVNINLYRIILTPSAPVVSVLPVGEGLPAGRQESVVLIRTQGKTLLIDTGPDASVLRALGTALPPWQRRLDAVLLTSTKKASVGGLPAILERYTVSEQLPLTENRRLTLAPDTYIDIVLTQNAPAGVYLSNSATTTRIR